MSTPALAPSPALVPDAEAVRAALSAVRYDRPLADSPLLQMDAVWEVLLREGVAPGARGSAWALGVLIHEVVEAHLAAARRAAGVDAAPGRSDAARLAADFAAGSPELELWSALYHRYLDPNPLPAGEIATRIGMPRRTMGRRLGAACRRLAAALIERDRAATRRIAARADLPLVAPATSAVAVPPGDQARPGDALLQAVRGTGRRRVALAPDALERLAAQRPADLDAYRLARIAAWSRPAYRVDARFVALTLLVDRGEAARDRWRARDETFDDLGAVLEAAASPALVLLGPPGSGKSTLLRRLELDLAMAGLRGESEAVPFFVSLARYGADRASAAGEGPAEWLAGVWRRRCPDLPPLTALLDARRLVLLLDGLNEMPHADFDQYRTQVLAWKRFLWEAVGDRPGVRVVFACRSLDYGAPLSSPELRVPQVRVEPMGDEQVRAFLHRHAPAQAEGIWRDLRGTARLELVRTPYLLALLVEQAIASGEAPIGRAALFTGFVRRALRREIERDHPLFQPGALLDARDYRRALSDRRWATPWALPENGALVPALARLAHGMQAAGDGGRALEGRVPFEEALALIDHPAAEEVVGAGEALAVLDEHRGRDEVLFFHQLLQEYFAARHLAGDAAAAASRCRVDVRAAAVAPSMAETVAALAVNEPLPPLPSTGWEETVRLAAAMSEDPARFVAAVAEANLALAGRAAAEPEVAARLPEPFVATLRDRLVALSADPAVDLRARIEAGLALGALGDPRFAEARGPDGPYVRPPMVEIPAGAYLMGDDGDAAPGAGPRHAVRLAAFDIGRFAVTNREWACFMAAGGYDDPRWWDTPDAAAWRAGELTAEGSRRWVRDWLAKMRAEPEMLARYAEESMSPEQVDMWRGRLAMDEDALRAHLEEKYPNRRYTAPYGAGDALHAGPTQPVSGICWYEARAYCLWLSAQTGRAHRLPTEAQWEAAARGGDERAYPWGEAFDGARCNTVESHVRRAAPVGVYARGRSPFGVESMAGDVGEWVSSLWGPTSDRCAFGYPYEPADGRERADAPSSVHRIQRGGSFLDEPSQARAVARTVLPPDTRFHGFGLRLVRSREGE